MDPRLSHSASEDAQLRTLNDELLLRNDWIVHRRKDGTAEVMIDHEHVSRSRLRVNARRWVLSKMLPCLHGDRPEGITKPEVDNDWAALLKAVDGKTRGLPSQWEGSRSPQATPQDAVGIIEQPRTRSDEERARPAAKGFRRTAETSSSAAAPKAAKLP